MSNDQEFSYLCRAWGETDLPCAEIVSDWEGVRQFMVREWLGSADQTDYDGAVTLDRLKADYDEHEEDQRGGPFVNEFEIGGVSVEKIVRLAAPAPAPDQTPDDEMEDGIHRGVAAGFALHGYRQGTGACIAFVNGARWWAALASKAAAPERAASEDEAQEFIETARIVSTDNRYEHGRFVGATFTREALERLFYATRHRAPPAAVAAKPAVQASGDAVPTRSKFQERRRPRPWAPWGDWHDIDDETAARAQEEARSDADQSCVEVRECAVRKPSDVAPTTGGQS